MYDGWLDDLADQGYTDEQIQGIRQWAQAQEEDRLLAYAEALEEAGWKVGATRSYRRLSGRCGMTDQHAESVAHDWKAEASGLAYMICEIRDRYLQAKEHMGGDSELLASSIFNAYKWVDGPLKEYWEAEQIDGDADG